VQRNSRLEGIAHWLTATGLLTDGKTEKMPTGNEQFGNLETKARWDAGTLKREL
jgi:hypothetical protein